MQIRYFSRKNRIAFLGGCLAVLTGCSALDGYDLSPQAEPEKESGIFGSEGLRIKFGNNNASAAETLGVNAYLWRASLDVLTGAGFPLASSDPFGGAITTEWHSLDNQPNTQFKVTSYVNSPELRANALRVLINKRTGRTEAWQETAVSPQTIRQFENAILQRARELRIAELDR